MPLAFNDSSSAYCLVDRDQCKSLIANRIHLPQRTQMGVAKFKKASTQCP